MNTPDELLALAAKIEALEGPSREVDAKIKAIYGHNWDYSANWGRWVALKGAKVTASLDAAMTLVPEGWDYSVERVEGECWAGVSLGVDQMPVLRAATPPLALCAAALRARAAQMKDKP